MRSYVRESDLMTKVYGKLVQDAWDIIVETIESAVDERVPKIYPNKSSVRRREKPKWWNDKVMDKIQKKREAYGKWIKSHDPKDWNVYAKW